MDQGFGSVLVLAGCCLVGISVVFVVWYLGDRAKRARLRGKKVFLKNVILGSDPAQYDLERSVPSISNFYSAIPGGLLASREEESEVIVELRWTCTRVGYYTGGGRAAYIALCRVVYRERSSGKAIDSAEFKGAAPPRTTLHGGIDAVFGAPPTKEIQNYLRNVLTPKERSPSSPRRPSSR